MPIRVICAGCHARFEVADKHAGKKGPCPKCKAVITIPEKVEDVVVHAPEEHGPKDSKGTAVLKPITRVESSFSVVWALAIAAAVIVVVAFAIVLRNRETVPLMALAAGAAVLGPALALGGYTFLRNDELEPYRGRTLLTRALVCGLCYAAIWGVYALAVYYVYPDGDRPELFALVFILPVVFAAGGLAAYSTLDLDSGSAVVHYALYLGSTVGLRVLMNLPPF